MAIQTNIEIWAGRDDALSVQVLNSAGVAVPLTDLSAITFEILESEDAAQALVTKSLSSGIIVTDSAHGIYEVTLTALETQNLDGAYYWQSVVTDLSGAQYVAAYGYLAARGHTGRGAYCTLEEALALISSIPINERTNPSTATCQVIVETIARDIDGVLMGRGVELPITDARALKYLRTINQYGACAAIIKSLKPINTGMGGDQGAFGYYEEKYKSGLYQLARKGFNLIGSEERGTVFHYGFGSNGPDDDTSFFKRSKIY